MKCLWDQKIATIWVKRWMTNNRILVSILLFFGKTVSKEDFDQNISIKHQYCETLVYIIISKTVYHRVELHGYIGYSKFSKTLPLSFLFTLRWGDVVGEGLKGLKLYWINASITAGKLNPLLKLHVFQTKLWKLSRFKYYFE